MKTLRGIPHFRRSVVAAVLLFAGVTLAAEPPQDVIKVFRTMAESLAEQDAGLFFEQFDPVMPGFAQMREDVEGLLAKGYVISTLEFESDSGDANSRQVEVDWLWHLSGEAQHRVVLKCTLVRKGKAWKITALSPSDFLRATP